MAEESACVGMRGRLLTASLCGEIPLCYSIDLKGIIMASSFIINDRPATALRTSDFHYDLPEALIAQHPMERRDASRLMVLDREKNTLEHKHFYDIVDYIP